MNLSFFHLHTDLDRGTPTEETNVQQTYRELADQEAVASRLPKLFPKVIPEHIPLSIRVYGTGKRKKKRMWGLN